MTSSGAGQGRQRGEIEKRAGGSLRVRVYAGIDPLTDKRHYLTETIPPGPRAARDAEKARTRLLAQVDERRNPRTRATVSQLLDRHLAMLNVEPTTLDSYRPSSTTGAAEHRREQEQPALAGQPYQRVAAPGH
jgi:hypothetical protein